MRRRTLFATALIAAICLFAPVASAHPGHDSRSGFTAGVGHPFSGIDHVLAMVAVGLWAAQLGGRALWLLPLTFVALMAGGGVLAGGRVPVPMVEQGILASVLVLGLLIAGAVKLPLAAVMGLVGFFAAFHGYAHVAEMIADYSPAAYAAGFLLATVVLHAVGVALGVAFGRLTSVKVARLAGAAIAACGLLLFRGIL